VVVGAGAGGGCVAKTLAAAGVQTLLLERGEWSKTDVYGEDDLSSQRSPWLTLGPGPGGARTCRQHFHDNGSFGVVVPWNAACVGSGTVTYGAMGWRFLETDFRLKTHYGEIPDSSVEDWPISYQDLEPYYDRAEYEVGVAGSNEGNPFAAPRKRPFPMPPFPLNEESKRVWAVGKKMGLHPFHVPFLRNSVPYNGRPACIHQRACVGFRCPIDAKCGTQNTVIPVALATGNCTLKTRAMVTQLLVDDNGRLNGVRYVDEEDYVHDVSAKAVVLSAGSNSTARLLLTSTSRLFPNGAGNNNDVVGRNITSHAYVDARGFLDDDIYEEAGPGTGVAFMDYSHDNPGFICGGVLHTDFVFTPAIFAAGSWSGVPRWGKAYKDFVRTHYKKMIRVCGPHQQTPRWENRIRLDLKRRDYWGIPLISVEGREHPNDAKARCFMSDRAKDLIAACGAKLIQQGGNNPKPSGGWHHGGQHQSGSCRMGTDPRKSVCDKWGRVWDFPNLFVADGSLHVNNGGMNPVLTIMALGFRVGEGVVKYLKG
jgi:choline dehydrogenase-like flavoprotein